MLILNLSWSLGQAVLYFIIYNPGQKSLGGNQVLTLAFVVVIVVRGDSAL